MKRLGLALAAIGVVCSGALAGGAVQAQQFPPLPPQPAYPLTGTLTLEAVPDVVAPSGEFEAVLMGCVPGETVFFVNFRPYQSKQAVCDNVAFSAAVTFTASANTGSRNILAYILPRNSDDPDVPDYPFRVLTTPYQVLVTLEFTPIPGSSGTGGGASGASIATTSGSGDWLPSSVSWSGIVRTFLGLLALLGAIFFVVLWRRRREDEQMVVAPAGRAVAPPDTSTPSLA